mgnify:CR=1 FL=1
MYTVSLDKYILWLKNKWTLIKMDKIYVDITNFGLRLLWTNSINGEYAEDKASLWTKNPLINYLTAII